MKNVTIAEGELHGSVKMHMKRVDRGGTCDPCHVQAWTSERVYECQRAAMQREQHVQRPLSRRAELQKATVEAYEARQRADPSGL